MMIVPDCWLFQTVDYETIAEDEDFERYVALTKELQRVDLTSSTREDKIALFVNVYNALVIHATVKIGQPTNMWQRWKVIDAHNVSLLTIFRLSFSTPFTI
jgi:hypothetical protein